MQYKMNLIPDPIDERDYMFKAVKMMSSAALPAEVDMRKHMPPIVDQDWLGSCTANAILGLREYLDIKANKPWTELARLYLYWHTRNLMGTVNEDSGAMLRDGMKVLNKIGCTPEIYQPYIPHKFREAPSEQAELNAPKFKIREYRRVLSFSDLQHALAEGLPVVIGATLFESFYDIGKDGIFPMPNFLTDRIIGRHAMLACGYKRINGSLYILVRNSYGTDWGDNGYGWMPEAYIKSLHVSDMWTGSNSVNIDDISFMDSIHHFVDKGVFDTPEFWESFEALFKAGKLKNEHFEYVFLGFRKLAADSMK